MNLLGFWKSMVRNQSTTTTLIHMSWNIWKKTSITYALKPTTTVCVIAWKYTHTDGLQCQTRNSANQHTQPCGGEKQPSIPLERSSASCPPQSSSTAPTWAWQTQQQCHPTDENGFASGEFQELVANNNTRHHNVSTQNNSYSLNMAAAL